MFQGYNMLKYKEIIDVKSDKLNEAIDSLSNFLEEICKDKPCEVEKELIRQIGIFNNKHFEKKSAEYIISKMRPSIGNKDAFELLNEKGINVETSKRKIEEAYYKAREFASQNSLQALIIPEEYTDYDYYVVLAMCAMDYWYEGLRDPESLYMLAYEWMSDVDASNTKVWDYFFN